MLEIFGENHPNVASSYNNLGIIYFIIGDYEKASSFYSKALNIRLEIFGENHPNVASSYSSLGAFYANTGDYEKAISFLIKALNIRLEIFGENHLNVAYSYNGLGVTCWMMGDYEQSISFLTKASNIKLEILGKKHPDVALSYNNLGEIYRNTGDYEQAISFHNKALNIRLETLDKKHPDIAQSYNNLGVVCHDTGDYEQAIKFHNKALNIRLETLGKKHPDVAQSYDNLGGIYYDRGDYKQAISFCDKALNIRYEILGEKHPYVATSYHNLGDIYKDRGDYEQAISFLNEALNIRLEMLGKKHPRVASSYHNLGLVYHDTGDYEKAIRFNNKALNVWLDVLGEKHPHVAKPYHALAKTYEETRNYKTADSLWQIVIPPSIERLKSTYLFLPNEQRIKYSNTLSSMNNDFYSFAVSNGTESTKQLATNSLLNTKSLALDYGISTNQLIKSINDTTLSAQYQQLNKLNKQVADAEILKDEELQEKGWNLPEIQEAQEALAFQMLQHPQLKSKLNPETIEWQDIQNYLASDEATVDFIEVNEKQDSLWAYYAVVIHKDLASPQFVRITDEKTLAEQLKTDRNERPNYLNNRRTRKALHKALWQPLAPYLEGIKTVHISPTNILYRVPFESLQNEKNEYLAAQYEFHYYSAIRDMLREQSRKMTYKNMVLLGHILYDLDDKDKYDIEYDSLFDRNTRAGIPPLKNTLAEVRQIGKIGKASGLDTTVLTIRAASEDTIHHYVRERAPSIIHFATHGAFLPPPGEQHYKSDSTSTRGRLSIAHNPLQRSVLMLYGANETWTKGRPIMGSGEDGILTALEVTALDLQNTNLVVLSACSTGLGDMHNTEGVFGLQRAFKLAGVEYVVASLWDVNDEATKDLMVKFYENLLKEKQAPATALRNAKDELRDAGYEPQDWAGFILIE